MKSLQQPSFLVHYYESFKAHCTYITRVPQCLSPRPIWDSHSLSRKRECLPRTKWGEDTLACGWGSGGSQFGRLEKKPSTLSILNALKIPNSSSPSSEQTVSVCFSSWKLPDKVFKHHPVSACISWIRSNVRATVPLTVTLYQGRPAAVRELYRFTTWGRAKCSCSSISSTKSGKFVLCNCWVTKRTLKVENNENGGGSGRWQMYLIGQGRDDGTCSFRFKHIFLFPVCIGQKLGNFLTKYENTRNVGPCFLITQADSVHIYIHIKKASLRQYIDGTEIPCVIRQYRLNSVRQ